MSWPRLVWFSRSTGSRTLNDVIGDMLKPHHFCKPIAKRPEDRRWLREMATRGGHQFFLGTDSAPHAQRKKECSSGCAGVFTAPLAMPLGVVVPLAVDA